MTLFSLICLAWVSSAPPISAATTNAIQSLTIHDAIERALAQNLDVRIERINPQIEESTILREQAIFEPALTGAAIYRDSKVPLDPERAAALGISSIEIQKLQLRTGVEGVLPTGTGYNIAAFDNRDRGTLAPDGVHTGNAAFTVTQPLLKNFWLGPNTTLLRVARVNRRIADEAFAERVIDTVSAVQNAYYDLVFAIEDHRAKQEDLGRARALLDENRKRVEVGVLSRLDVTQAEAGVAEREEAVIIAERVIKENENTLKRLISGDVLVLRGVALEPVDTAPVRDVELDVVRSVNTALELRPDYQRARFTVDRQGIVVAFNRNQLWPQVDLEGSYGLNGRGGSFGSFTDNTVSGNNPEWSVGVVVRIPLGNRAARSNYTTARLEQEKALLDLKRVEQNIIVEVDNAVGQIETNRKRIDATAVAVRLAQESLNAEQEKLKAGTSTSFLVLQAQAQLAETQAAAIRARSDYNKSLVDLQRVEGSTLQQHGIELDDGRASHEVMEP